MDDGLFEFGLGRAVGLCACEVSAELVGAAAGDEAGDRDEAAVPRGEFWLRSQMSPKSRLSVRSTSLGAKSPMSCWARVWFESFMMESFPEM